MAARKIDWIAAAGVARGVTGAGLKHESGGVLDRGEEIRVGGGGGGGEAKAEAEAEECVYVCTGEKGVRVVEGVGLVKLAG